MLNLLFSVTQNPASVEPLIGNHLMQPPQKTDTKAMPSVRAYLKKMQSEADDLEVSRAKKKVYRAANLRYRTMESLEDQILRWWVNLPEDQRQRRFQIMDISAHCKGKFHSKPALREVAAALRTLGWNEKRDWTKVGRNRRFWQR